MKASITSSGPEETLEIGRRVGECLTGHDILFLDGDLGAGKTVLAKGLYLGTGGTDPDEVLSPSYTVVNLYTDGDRPFYHVDLYRLEEASQLEGLEYEDFLYLNAGLTVVEWPRSAPDLVADDDYMTVTIRPGADDSERVLTFHAEGDHYRAVFDELTSC